MVHLVPDEAVDAGPVLGTVEVPFADGDTLEAFSIRMHKAERTLLVSVVANLVSASGVSPERAGVPITG
jgi:folate-dependent phosphoribosylglycinamide formyltransferase PurN